MPTYEYECSQCGKQFEYFQSMKDEPLTDCPEAECGGQGTVRRLISRGGGLIFKGSGFYQTDYKKQGGCGFSSKDSGGGKDKAESPSCANCPMAEKKD